MGGRSEQPLLMRRARRRGRRQGSEQQATSGKLDGTRVRGNALEQLRAAVAGRLDRDLVSGPQHEVAAVLGARLAHSFDEAVKEESPRVRLESFEIDDDARSRPSPVSCARRVPA